MARANRHVIPGQVWHLTHRCHKKQWLLKFARDRRRWMLWLFEARRRYGLSVLNYVVTCNHIHLLVKDNGRGEIHRSMQLIAGRTAQEYNQRKKRQGAFWEDRYHSTAVQSDTHLQRCLTYIDMNMVRAGAVEHPSDWLHSGLHELSQPQERYRRLDLDALANLLSINTREEQLSARLDWIQTALEVDTQSREPIWTSSVAVGSKVYVEAIQQILKLKQPGRAVIALGADYCLKEPLPPLYRVFSLENAS